MLYGEYLKGLRGSLLSVRRAEKAGVILSRYESFDNIFKQELAMQEGILKNTGVIKRYSMFIQDIDYRIASFYAKYLSEAIHLAEKGYSFQEVRKLFKSIVSYAKRNYIFNDRVGMSIVDKNNVLTISLSYSKLEDILVIENAEQFIESVIAFVSFLGCWEEKEKANRDWFGVYLSREYRKIKKGTKAKIYVDKNSAFVNLNDYEKGNTIAKSASDTIIEFPLKNDVKAL